MIIKAAEPSSAAVPLLLSSEQVQWERQGRDLRCYLHKAHKTSSGVECLCGLALSWANCYATPRGIATLDAGAGALIGRRLPGR